MTAPGATEDRTKRFVRRTPITFAFVVLALLAIACWFITDSEPQLAIATAIVVGIALDAWAAIAAVRDVELRLSGPEDAFAGEPTEWVVQAHGLRRPVALTPALSPRPPAIRLDSGTAGTITLPPTFRGVARSVVVDVTATGPIGLFDAGRRYRVTPDVPVFIGPRAERFDPEFPKPRAVGYGFSEVAPRGDDLYRSVRPYLRGDERRRIHWKASAHHGELMVRESEGSGVVVLLVVVDLGPPGPMAESIAGAAAWTAEEALRRGWFVELVTLDGTTVAPAEGELGSPFGPSPVVRTVPTRLETRRQRVTSARAVRAQLAGAAYGTPELPTTKGLICLVGPRGIEWP